MIILHESLAKLMRLRKPGARIPIINKITAYVVNKEIIYLIAIAEDYFNE